MRPSWHGHFARDPPAAETGGARAREFHPRLFYPHYSVHIRRDDGLNWDEGTVVDYPVWAMGCMIEVEPDTVLCTYMNAERNQPLLAQRIRVTWKGIRPVPNLASELH